MEGKTNSRENNFNIIRFMAAIMVMAGHMAYIGIPCQHCGAKEYRALELKSFS